MSQPGDNLPGFLARQLEFAAHIRNPAAYPMPGDVDPRRMQVYVELFFNNIEALLASAFPVARAVLGPARWPALVRAFIHRHSSTSPYFPDVSQEFMQFINGLEDNYLPGFMLELCHYEWVELALGLADPEVPADLDPGGDLRTGQIVRSPLAWPLSYAYPVHRIGPGHQPESPGEQPTHLVVYRRRDDSIGFMEVTALTQRLLQLLDGEVTGAEALQTLAGELSPAAAAAIAGPAVETLERLRSAGILLGVRVQKFDQGADPGYVRGAGSAGEKLE